MSKRIKTKYPGVFWIEGLSAGGKSERIYYILYRKNGKLIEEPVGRQFQDDMTPARAALIRTRRIEGDDLSNKEKRNIGKGVGKTIDSIFDEYEAAKGHKPTTVRAEKTKYAKYIGPAFGQKSPSEITQKDCDLLLKKLRDETKAAQTIKHIIGLLLRLLKFSNEQGYCPPHSIKLNLPKINNEKTEDLTPEEVQRLIKAIDEDPHPYAGKLMKMALFTGMRAGELYKLKWDDVDFERGFINIRDPKGGKDKRIPINDTVRELLETVARLPQCPFVFPSRDGSQRNTIKKQAIRIRDAAGIQKDFRPIHGLRHVFASALASSGQVDMYTLQKLLTHSDPKMTQRYAHLRDESLKKAADIAGDIFKPKS